jgi:predicted nucleotidyltransferase
VKVTDERLREVDAIASRVRRLVDSQDEVQAAIVVGSYAYGRPRMDSDIDIILALADRSRWVSEDAWATQLLGEPFQLVHEQDWGPLRERRLQTASGLEVEFGLVTSEWFATPVDPGTAKVLTDGCLILTDRKGFAGDALRWLALPATEWSSTEATGSEEPSER